MKSLKRKIHKKLFLGIPTKPEEKEKIYKKNITKYWSFREGIKLKNKKINKRKNHFPKLQKKQQKIIKKMY